MIVIGGPRQTGRTTTMLTWMLAAPGRVGIFRNHRFAELARLWALANKLPLESWQFKTPQALTSFGQLADASEVGIDDLDFVLAQLTGRKVALVVVDS